MSSIIKTEDEYNAIVTILTDKNLFVCSDKHKKYRLIKKASRYTLIDNVLYCKEEENGFYKKVIPTYNTEEMRKCAVVEHAKTHFGMRRMEYHLKKLYITITREIIRQVTNECLVCSKQQPLKTKEKFKHILAEKPFDRVMIDLIDLRLYSACNDGYSWILTCIDVFTKFAFTYSLKSKSAKEVVMHLKNLIYQFGAPCILQCDNGKEFTNSDITELCRIFSIRIIHGRPRHPQSQGQVERFNQTLTRSLSKNAVRGEDNAIRWVDILQKTTYEYNIATHNATGKTPFTLFFRREGFNSIVVQDNDSLLPESEDSTCEIRILDGINDADTGIEESGKVETSIINLETTNEENFQYDNTKYLERMDKKNVHHSIHNFVVGDLVLVAKDFDANSKTKKYKFDSFFHHETKILEILPENRVLVNLEGKNVKVPMTRIKIVRPK